MHQYVKHTIVEDLSRIRLLSLFAVFVDEMGADVRCFASSVRNSSGAVVSVTILKLSGYELSGCL